MTKIINAAGNAFTEELSAWFGTTVEHVDVRASQPNWPKFEVQEAHVVFYQRPEHLIVAGLREKQPLEAAVNTASQVLTVLLQQQKKNRRGYRLVDIDQARQHPKALAQALTSLAIETKEVQAQPYHNDPLLLVAQAAVQHNEALRDQVELLEASSLPLAATDTNVLGVDLVGVVTTLDNDAKALQQAENSLATLEAENSELSKQIKTLSDQSAKSTEVDTQLKELTEENELLLLQLQQVQEELEHYFIENKTLSQKLVTDETQVKEVEQAKSHASNLQQENTSLLQQLLATQTELEKALNSKNEAKADKEATVVALKADFRKKADIFKAKAAKETQALKAELDALRQKLSSSVNSQEHDLLLRKYQSQIAVKNEKLHSFSQRRKEEKARYEAEIEALKAELAGYERQAPASQTVAAVGKGPDNAEGTESKQVASQNDATKPALPVTRRAKRKLASMLGLRKAGPIKHSDPERELLDQQINLVENSNYFDRQWYLQTYPDVAEDVLKNDANPVEHYVRYGGFEARNPSPHFDSQFYLDSNPDVAEAEMNPLVHYLQYGKEEQRPALPNLSQSQGF